MEVKGDDGRKLDRSKRWGLVLPEVSRAARIILAYLLTDCLFAGFWCLDIAPGSDSHTAGLT